MEVSSLQEVKARLVDLSQKELLGLCLTLCRYKKDNKEYLDYLLLKAGNKEGFIQEIKEEIDARMMEVREQKNPFPIRKQLRALLRIITKYSRYMNDKAAQVELLIYFCLKIKEKKIPISTNARLANLYEYQVKKIRGLISKLHEDVQDDYLKDLQAIS